MGRLGIFGYDSAEAHRVEHNPTALDHNLLASDVETALRRADSTREALDEHGEKHVQNWEVDSLKRRVNELEIDNISRPAGADVARAAIGGALFVLAAGLLIRVISAAATSGEGAEK